MNYRTLIDQTLSPDLALFARSMGYTEGKSQRIYRVKGEDKLVWADPCTRCGGSGIWGGPYYGGTCFRCGGQNSRTRELRRTKVETILKKARKAETIRQETLRLDALNLSAAELRAIEADESERALTREAAGYRAFQREEEEREEQERQAAYKAEQERKARREANRAASLAHLTPFPAEPKERVRGVALRVLVNKWISEGYAYNSPDRYLVKLETLDGAHRLTWFTGPTELEEGQEIVADFTVKEHNEYKGERSTIVNRLKAKS